MTPEQHSTRLQAALQQLADCMTNALKDDVMLDFGLAKSAADTYYISSFRTSKTIRALSEPTP